MKKHITVIISLFIALGIHSQTVTISGISKEYRGDEIVFNQYADLITMTEIEVGKCVVDNNGFFTCALKIDETSYIFSHLGVYRIYFFVEPGKSYELVLPEKQEKTEAQRLNPFFRENDLHVGIKNIQMDDINFLTNAFDLSFNEKFDIIINDSYKGKNSINIDSLINTIEKKYSLYNNNYFNNYRIYRYGLLKQITFLQKSRSISTQYFQNRPILYSNNAYMELFNLLYDKFFLFFSRTTKGNEVYRNISVERSLTNLKSTLATDELLKNDTLMELVILKGVYDGFFDDKFSRSALLNILDSLYFTSKVPEHLVIAENIRNKVTKLLPGFVPAPFELYDSKGNLKKLEEFKGKYVYLNFCTTTSYTCLQEFPLLKNIYDKHKSILEIVTICVDKDKNDISNLLKNNSYDWTFLHYGNKPEIIKEFDVRAYPTYFLIGPDRKIEISPAPGPKENFELQFFKLLRSKGEI